MMYVELAQPLAPGATTVFDLAYRFNMPEHGADRMGRDGSLYEIAQWYPRMAVYDDVHGWNTDQYLGQGEFYLEYGDIDYEVTLPAGYIVAGTGTLQNPRAGADRRPSAPGWPRRSSPTPPIAIVTAEELTSGAARPQARRHADLALPGRATCGTWRGRPSPDYLWDASGLGRHPRPGVLPAVGPRAPGRTRPR